MSTIATKIGLIVGGLATTSVIGTTIYFYNLKTIEQQILREGYKLISDFEDYKFVLFSNKDSSELKKAISKDILNFKTQGEELKNWCESNLKKWISNNELLSNAKEWCTIPKVKLLKDKLKGKLHDSSSWQNKFKEFSKDGEAQNKLLLALNATKPTTNLTKDSETGGVILDKWCSSALNQKIYEVDSVHKTEKNIENWCFNKEQ